MVPERHLMADYVPMFPVIAPQQVVSQEVGSIKVKSAIHLAWVYGERRNIFVGMNFGIRASSISPSVGLKQ